MIKISTRGFIGVKKKGIISGKYNHSDSYYSQLGGRNALNAYFDKADILDLSNRELETAKDETATNLFIVDGLYCEYAYIHNLDDDTLEIYRGFFHAPQWTPGHLLSYDKTKYFTHLVMVVDRKIHTKEQVIKAMNRYYENRENEVDYPEHEIINICQGCFKPLEIGKEFCSEKCESLAVARKV